MMLGQINFAPCTGCRNSGECVTHQQCANLSQQDLSLLERVRLLPLAKVEQGWECPRCRTIHAPFIPACHCKPTP